MIHIDNEKPIKMSYNIFTSKGYRYGISIMLILLMVTGITIGTIIIYKSQKEYLQIECKLLNITSFECDIDTWSDNYKTVTYILLLLNNKTIETYMVNSCFTCRICKDLYNVNNFYNCSYINNRYQIFNNKNTLMLYQGIGVIFFTILILTPIFLICVLRYNKLEDYTEL